MKVLNSIQLIRGIAALLVVISHALGTAKGGYREHGLEIPIAALSSQVVDFGAIGVDFFFVISGFIIYYISYPHLGNIEKYKSFIFKRLVRIYPVYIFFLCVYALLLLINGYMMDPLNPLSVLEARVPSPEYLLFSLLLISSTDPSGNYTPLLGVGWTLMYEIFFYMVFSFLFLFGKNYITPLILIFLVFAISNLIFLYPSSSVFAFYTNPIILEFVFGMLIARFLIAGHEVNRWIIIVGFIIAVLVMLYTLIYGIPQSEYGGLLNHWRFLFWGIPAALAIFTILHFEQQGKFKASRRAVWLGDVSFSLYLSHAAFTLPVVNAVWFKIGIHKVIGADFFFVILICSSIFVAAISYRLIELPILSYIRS